jgi:hypothetical protein
MLINVVYPLHTRFLNSLLTGSVADHHDILVWIRIRIQGSMPLTNGSISLYFHHWPLRRQQKTNLKKVFLHFTF